MKKLYSLLVMALLVCSVIPFVMAADYGGPGTEQGEITPIIKTEDFPPLVWMCYARAVCDDEVEPGTEPKPCLKERAQNYAFTGESIKWEVLVMDKNGINKVEDVYATVGYENQGEDNPIEVNCVEDLDETEIYETCNARIDEEKITEFNHLVMRYYTCTLTIEPDMYGDAWITVEATDLDGETGTMAENEYWYLNPIIALTIDGDLAFEDVRPGTSSYSDTLLVGNDADIGSGVRLEMYIAGTDFYDSDSSGAMCPTTNQLSLDAFRYFATNGYYSTMNVGGIGPYSADAEGYMGIPHGERITQAKEIIGTQIYSNGGAINNIGNVLTPGSEMALTFRLDLPEPCNGDFDTGSIYFWGEAI